jgi:hypothetical protein
LSSRHPPNIKNGYPRKTRAVRTAVIYIKEGWVARFLDFFFRKNFKQENSSTRLMPRSELLAASSTLATIKKAGAHAPA